MTKDIQKQYIAELFELFRKAKVQVGLIPFDIEGALEEQLFAYLEFNFKALYGITPTEEYIYEVLEEANLYKREDLNSLHGIFMIVVYRFKPWMHKSELKQLIHAHFDGKCPRRETYDRAARTAPRWTEDEVQDAIARLELNIDLSHILNLPLPTL